MISIRIDPVASAKLRGTLNADLIMEIPISTDIATAKEMVISELASKA